MGETREEGRDVVGETREEGRDVVGETGEEGRDVVGETGEEGRDGKVGEKEGSFWGSDTTTEGAGRWSAAPPSSSMARCLKKGENYL